MLRIDKAIFNTNKSICENISKISYSDRGFASQNILSQLRNFVECIAKKIYSKGEDIDPYNYEKTKLAIEYIKTRGELKFLSRFHEMLQFSVSHYTEDKNNSERLMLKYYEYLLKIKKYLKNEFDMEVLENIQEFPLNTDTELMKYYKKISERIEEPSKNSRSIRFDERYYVQKVKPFFIDGEIYYEVTFTVAYSNTSKFDRVIGFTKHEIIDNYAVKFSIHSDIIEISGKKMSIFIIDRYEIAIRPCEFENFSEIFGPRIKINVQSTEYKELMSFISRHRMSLAELVSSNYKFYYYVRNKILENVKIIKIYNLLDLCREIISTNKPGSNILRYLLHKMNNRIIKQQINNKECHLLSNLYLSFGCIPFDKMPFCSSLIKHNPKFYDLMESIPTNGREHELFARYIRNNTEIEGKLFTPIDEIKNFSDINELIKRYNNNLYYKHTGRKLEKFKNHVYLREYAEDSYEIIKKLQELSNQSVSQYRSSVDSWLYQENYIIDDEKKKEILRNMFENSRVAMIYGSAGTGKTTLLNHIANFWSDKSKLFLANTHPAVSNMRRRITAEHSEYSTIAKFILDSNENNRFDILFIDECSTVSNSDMRKILEKSDFKLLVLVGDIYQIESIYFGNWFSIAQKFIPKTSIFELTHPYRTTNENLIKVWDRVRKLDSMTLELFIQNGYISNLNDSIFEKTEDDEIILCLNYDGLYGINNINSFLQDNNNNEEVMWGINTYKIGDPVLFNESNIFSPLIYNNSKGKILDIEVCENQIFFDIELDKSINELDAMGYNFQLIGESESGNSIISFSVNRYRTTDEDDDYNSTLVPFQISYAVSIHKAQGLEYDSVKVVITNETEEQITHNIFYTAITRAKEKLKIYCSPESSQTVFKNFKVKNNIKDTELLSNLYSLKKN